MHAQVLSLELVCAYGATVIAQRGNSCPDMPWHAQVACRGARSVLHARRRCRGGTHRRRHDQIPVTHTASGGHGKACTHSLQAHSALSVSDAHTSSHLRHQRSTPSTQDAHIALRRVGSAQIAGPARPPQHIKSARPQRAQLQHSPGALTPTILYIAGHHACTARRRRAALLTCSPALTSSPAPAIQEVCGTPRPENTPIVRSQLRWPPCSCRTLGVMNLRAQHTPKTTATTAAPTQRVTPPAAASARTTSAR